MEVRDSHSLIKAQREVTVPFSLRARRENLDGSPQGETVHVTFLEILRLLPGKRIVARARCGDQDVLIKAFLGRTAHRYVSRERTGVELIISAGVRAPKPLWQAEFLDGHGHMLALEYLEGSSSLQDKWDAAEDEEERVDVLTRAMIIIAKLHNQGIVQTDIHLANFLISQGRIFTIDGGGIVRKTDPPLARKASMENLSWFFAQLLPKYDEFVQVVLPAYDAVRNWSADPDRLIDLHKSIYLSRESRKRTYLDKAFRDCTRFKCDSSLRRFFVCERTEYSNAMAALLDDPDSFIARGVVLKKGNSSTVARVDLEGRSLVVKRYNIKSPLHRLSRMFRRSRAWTSWENAYHMEFLGIRSLKPIAMLERRLGPLRGTAYLVTEYIEGPDALVLLKSLKHYNEEVEALADVLRNLSSSQISHGDLKATNFVMGSEGPVIIDLDAMREHKDLQTFRKAFHKDIDRFMKNWEGQPELTSKFEGLLKFPT